MSAPTEEEIRSEIARAWTEPLNPVTFHASPESSLENGFDDVRALGDGLHEWADMRKSETDRLDAIVKEEFREIDDLTETLKKMAVEATVRAEMRFWQEHPDAPRAVREPVPA